MIVPKTAVANQRLVRANSKSRKTVYRSLIKIKWVSKSALNAKKVMQTWTNTKINANKSWLAVST